MQQLTNVEFMQFIDSFKGKCYIEHEKGKDILHKFYDSVTELSRSDTKKADSLITNPFEMYALDWICKDCKKMKSNLPSTTDAIFYNEKKNGDLVLHIIEFKFLSYFTNKMKFKFLKEEIYEKNSKVHFSRKFFEFFNDIESNFKDDIEFKLRLKPFETLYIVLPILYDVYCYEENKIKKDIKSFLNNIEIRYWVFLGNKSDSKTQVTAMANRLKKPYIRLENGVVRKAEIRPKHEFENVLNKEILRE